MLNYYKELRGVKIRDVLKKDNKEGFVLENKKSNFKKVLDHLNINYKIKTPKNNNINISLFIINKNSIHNNIKNQYNEVAAMLEVLSKNIKIKRCNIY